MKVGRTYDNARDFRPTSRHLILKNQESLIPNGLFRVSLTTRGRHLLTAVYRYRCWSVRLRCHSALYDSTLHSNLFLNPP